MRRSPLVAVSTALAMLLPVGVATAGGAGAAPAPSYAHARSTPIEDPYYPAKGDPSVDALHYDLALGWAPRTRTLTGTARITFRATSSSSRLQLDLGDPLRVQRVRLDGRAVRHSHPGKNLVVSTDRALVRGSRHVLTVVYHGKPRPVAAPTTRADIPAVGWTVTKRGEVWAMQEPFGAYTWYPVNDQPSDKAFYDVRISAPRGMVGIFNGKLRSRRTTHGRTVTRWHLASPAASYLTTVAIGDYVRYTDKGPHKLPISYWVPRRDQRALPELRRTPAMIRWLEKRLGRYPFDRAGAIVVPSDSAMETQTLVTMGNRLLDDRQVFRADLLHEYAHQWYGDTVTPDNWKDLWLNEAFAMYTQIRWEVSRGWRTMDQWRAILRDSDQSLRNSDGPPGEYDRRRFGELCVYFCGALMLDELRTRLGATLFDAVWRGWPQGHRDASVGRADYIGWLNARTGQDLGPFITSWLTSPTTPVR